MTLDQLEVIQAVADSGSFHAAAEKLNRSQPALSAAIKNLENEFDLLIFDRSQYRARLTEAGAVFLSAARSALQASAYAARVARELSKKENETLLRVSVDPLLNPDCLLPIIRVCRNAIPSARLLLEKSILHGSSEKLMNGEIELALAGCPADVPGLERVPIESIRLVGAIAKNCVKAGKTVSKSELSVIPQILVYDGAIDRLQKTLFQSRQTYISSMQIFVPDHSMKLGLIEAGEGWGLMSAAELKARSRLCSISTKLVPHRQLEICLLRARDRALGPLARKIWQTLNSESGQAPEEPV